MQSNYISDVGGFKTLFVNFFFAISVVKNLCVCGGGIMLMLVVFFNSK